MEKIRDKYIFEDKPNRDIDFIEILLPAHEVDKFVNKYGAMQYKQALSDTDKAVLARMKKRQERILKKVWKAASVCLTERQFEIFSLRYKAGLKGIQIAQILGVNQSYIPRVIRSCTEKLKKMLGRPSKMSNRGFYVGRKPYKKKASRHNQKKKSGIKRRGKNVASRSKKALKNSKRKGKLKKRRKKK